MDVAEATITFHTRYVFQQELSHGDLVINTRCVGLLKTITITMICNKTKTNLKTSMEIKKNCRCLCRDIAKEWKMSEHKKRERDSVRKRGSDEKQNRQFPVYAIKLRGWVATRAMMWQYDTMCRHIFISFYLADRNKFPHSKMIFSMKRHSLLLAECVVIITPRPRTSYYFRHYTWKQTHLFIISTRTNLKEVMASSEWECENIWKYVHVKKK